MKYIDKAFKIAEELVLTLKHNKYILDNESELIAVIGARYGVPMEEAYREGISDGKNTIIVNDLTPLNPEISSIKNWN